jgi:3-phosphoshikimate 1-carboxyvinyltransferase
MQTYEVKPVSGAICGSIRPPGSKSLTNRALIVAALANGPSKLTGVLDSQDIRVMIDSLQKLGFEVEHRSEECVIEITGCRGTIPADSADLWLENSGTSIRFLTAMCSLGSGTFRLDGNTRMRERPILDLVNALNGLGTNARCELETSCPPVVVESSQLSGGTTTVAGNLSSQYLSALLMSAPAAQSEVTLQISGELVSKPYIEMTINLMQQFGVEVTDQNFSEFKIAPQKYQSREYDIEPDASAASYFFAAAAVTGGKITVAGLSQNALQGDIEFVSVLEQMGCQVDWQPNSVTVTGGALQGIDVDMNAISDTAQTLAAIAPFANGPTTIRNVEHMRHKETDRISAVVTELERLGVKVEEAADGMTIHPGPIQPATIETYDDHRMAMSFALIGLNVPGIQIADPGCTRKTYPRFFEDLEQLCGTNH